MFVQRRVSLLNESQKSVRSFHQLLVALHIVGILSVQKVARISSLLTHESADLHLVGANGGERQSQLRAEERGDEHERVAAREHRSLTEAFLRQIAIERARERINVEFALRVT